MFSFDAELRKDSGKADSRRLRRKASIPAIACGLGKTPVALALAHNPILHAQEKEAFYHSPITLRLKTSEGSVDEVIVKVKAIQRHPFKPQILHVDFLMFDTASGSE